MDQEQIKVLVVGATGYLGQQVVRAAHDQRFFVRALARSRERLGQVESLCDEVFVGEVTKVETLQGLCDGVDIVFSSLGITRQTDKVTYMDVDFAGNATVLELARKAGCKQFVYVSVVSPEKVIHTDIVFAKEKFVQLLRGQDDLGWTVVRPTGFFSDIKEFLDMARAGRCFVLGNGKSLINPIDGADLAAFCVDKFNKPECFSKEFDVGGPETFTWEEIAKLAMKVANQKESIWHIPYCLLAASACVVKPFNRRLWNLLEFFSAARFNMEAPKFGSRKLEQFFQTAQEETLHDAQRK